MRSQWKSIRGISISHQSAVPSLTLLSTHGIELEGSLVVQQAAGPEGRLSKGAVYFADRAFSVADVLSFLRLTGDTNRIHFSHHAAKAAGFRAPVLPGMLAASLFPAIIGSQFEGAVYVTQSLNFTSPMLVEEQLRAEVEVKQVKNFRQRFRVDFYTRLLSPDPSQGGNSSPVSTVYVSGEASAIIHQQYISSSES